MLHSYIIPDYECNCELIDSSDSNWVVLILRNGVRLRFRIVTGSQL